MKTLVLTTSNGIRLSAELFTPHAQQNVKHAVVVCHGLGSDKHSQIFELLRECVLAEGISTLAFDFTSHGNTLIDLCARRIIQDQNDTVEKAQ